MGKTGFALFAGVVHVLALLSLGRHAHHGAREDCGYPKRPKPGSYADPPPRQSPEIVCKRWRPAATWPLSQLCRAAASKPNTPDTLGAHFSILQQFASRLSRVSTAWAAVYRRSWRENGPRARRSRAGANLVHLALARERSDRGERKPHEYVA